MKHVFVPTSGKSREDITVAVESVMDYLESAGLFVIAIGFAFVDEFVKAGFPKGYIMTLSKQNSVDQLLEFYQLTDDRGWYVTETIELILPTTEAA